MIYTKEQAVEYIANNRNKDSIHAAIDYTILSDHEMWAELAVHTDINVDELAEKELINSSLYREAYLSKKLLHDIQHADSVEEFYEYDLFFDESPSMNIQEEEPVQTDDNDIAPIMFYTKTDHRNNIKSAKALIVGLHERAKHYQQSKNMALYEAFEGSSYAALATLSERYPSERVWVEEFKNNPDVNHDVNATPQFIKNERDAAIVANLLKSNNEDIINDMFIKNPQMVKHLAQDNERYFDIEYCAKLCASNPDVKKYLHEDIQHHPALEKHIAAHMLTNLNLEDCHQIARHVSVCPTLFDKLPVDIQQRPDVLACCIVYCERNCVPTYEAPIPPQNTKFDDLVDAYRYEGLRGQERALARYHEQQQDIQR